MTGRVTLSPRQSQIARLINEGFTYAQIATRLDISPRTVEVHAAELRRKFGERTTRRAASRARALGPRSVTT